MTRRNAACSDNSLIVLLATNATLPVAPPLPIRILPRMRSDASLDAMTKTSSLPRRIGKNR